MTKASLNLVFHLILILFLVGVSLAEDGAKKKSLKVAGVLSLTGIAAVHGNGIRDGVEFAKSQLEAEGWQVDLRFEDDATQARQTVSSVERLASSGYKYFIGPTWGILAVPAAPVFQRRNLLSLQPCNSSDFVKVAAEQYYFVFSPPTSAKPAMREFLKKFQGKAAAVINAQSEWGELWNSLFLEVAREEGVNIAFHESPQFSEFNQSLPTLVTRIRQKSVELIFTTSSMEQTAVFVSELEKQQVKTALLSPDLRDAFMEKVVGDSSSTVEGYGIAPKSDPQFSEAFAHRYGRAPRKYTDNGYDALRLLAKAVEEVGDDVSQVKAYFNRVDHQGKSGRLKFTESHDVIGAGYETMMVIYRK